MKLNRKWIFALSLSLILLLVFSSVVIRLSPAVEPKDRSQELLEALSRESGISISSLELLKETSLHLPNLNQKLSTAKIRDRETDQVHEVTLDASGKRVDKATLFAQELAARRSRYGKLEPELHARLQTLGPAETIEVAIWIVAPDDPLSRPNPEEIEAEARAIIKAEKEAGTPRRGLLESLRRLKERVEAEGEVRAQQKRQRLSMLQEPLVGSLHGMGAEILDINDLAPLITARLTKTQIEILSDRSDIEGIYLSRENRPLLDVSVLTVTALPVWARGVTGFNQKVAIIEQGIDFFTNPYLVGFNRLNSCIGEHATWVAGVAASVHPVYRGVAYEATLLGGAACDFQDFNLQAATSWAANSGGRVHNNSWGSNTGGSPSSMSRFHDTVVRDWGVTVVDAAGNCENQPNCRFAQPFHQ